MVTIACLPLGWFRQVDYSFNKFHSGDLVAEGRAAIEYPARSSADGKYTPIHCVMFAPLRMLNRTQVDLVPRPPTVPRPFPCMDLGRAGTEMRYNITLLPRWWTNVHIEVRGVSRNKHRHNGPHAGRT